MFLVQCHVDDNHGPFILCVTVTDFNEVTFYDSQGLESADKQVAKLRANFFAKARSDTHMSILVFLKN